jgi:hypothetical protein
MATIEKALQIAAKAHEGQVDKEGMPYILHPLRGMAGVQGTEAQIVAVFRPHRRGPSQACPRRPLIIVLASPSCHDRIGKR